MLNLIQYLSKQTKVLEGVWNYHQWVYLFEYKLLDIENVEWPKYTKGVIIMWRVYESVCQRGFEFWKISPMSFLDEVHAFIHSTCWIRPYIGQHRPKCEKSVWRESESVWWSVWQCFIESSMSTPAWAHTFKIITWWIWPKIGQSIQQC